MNSPNPVSENPVEKQYSEYSYPEAGDDIPTWLQSWNYGPYDPSFYEALHWPEGRPKADLDVLVAGCGTMQAAVLAFNNPECKFTGIEFSQTSIAHEERLRERHNLQNLTLQKMDLRDVSKLGRSFDLIVSSGVLHHLPDPGEGLRALASVLEPRHGVMALMVYGRMARTGVYALQDAFRRIGVQQTAEGIKFVRATIERLPPRHPARWYYDTSPEMNSDAAIVDTFLHSQDIAYSVQDVLDFVEKNGLTFKGWLDSGMYNEDWAGLDSNISDRDRWSIIENFSGRIGQHRFMVSLPQRDPKSDVTFEDARWLDYFPQLNPGLQLSEFDQRKCFRGSTEFTMTPLESILLQGANGRKTIVQILKHKGFAGLTPEQRNRLAKEFYLRMWRHGHVFYSAIPIKRRSIEEAP
jgi:Trans-aconitate methyltransferase